MSRSRWKKKWNRPDLDKFINDAIFLEKIMESSNLEQQFTRQLLRLHELAKESCNYNATRSLRMIYELGGVATARELVLSSELSQGFTAMWECGRLDLTIEATILQEPWRQLFTEDVLSAAQRKLQEVGYNP
jgi:hypothetical protein